MDLTLTADWIGNTHRRTLTIAHYRAEVTGDGNTHTAAVHDLTGGHAQLHSRHDDEGDALDWAEATIRDLHDRDARDPGQTHGRQH